LCRVGTPSSSDWHVNAQLSRYSCMDNKASSIVVCDTPEVVVVFGRGVSEGLSQRALFMEQSLFIA
jgi:hypothetical protein